MPHSKAGKIHGANQRGRADVTFMVESVDHVPEDTAALRAALIETRAKLAGAELLIEQQQLLIDKMKRAMFGPRSERSQRLIDQLELQLEELAAAKGEEETKAETKHIQVQGFTRRQATRRNFPLMPAFRDQQRFLRCEPLLRT